MDYVHTPNPRFQPMNANMGIVPYDGPRGRRNRRERNRLISERALAAINGFRESRADLFTRSIAA